MNIEKRIRAIAAKKVKVIITGKTRNRDGFKASYPSTGETTHRSKKEALQALLATIRCSPELVFRIEAVKITPNPKHKADVPWKRKLL